MSNYVPATTQAKDVDELRRYTVNELNRLSGSLATLDAAGQSANIEVVTALPTTGNFEGRVVYLTTDDKLYTNNGSAWTPVANSFEITGDSIMTYAQATAPSAPNIGDLWFDTSTTANTPKRWNGSAWVALADARVAANGAAIVTEQNVRSSADAALAQSITNLAATVSTNNSTQSAAISSEQTVRANADTALASNITALTATVNSNNSAALAAISSEQTVRANADTALAQDITNLAATVATNNSAALAAISSEQTVRANADTALASSVTSLTTVVSNNNATVTAAINSEQTARISADDALAQQITQLIVSGGAVIMTYAQSTAPSSPNIGDLWFDTSSTANTPKRWSGSAWVPLADARVAVNAAAIVTEQSARITNDTALASNITDLAAVVSSNNSTQSAAISNEQTARANADTALASSITALTATVNTNNSTQSAAISNEQTVRANADTALASSVASLTAVVNTNNSTQSAAISTEQTVRANADTALSSSITALTATVNTNNSTQSAAISTEQTARANADTALSSSITALTATVNTNNSTLSSAISTEQTARANGDAANAASITSLTSTVGTKARTFFQTSAPSATAPGDLWFDTDDNNTLYRWSGSAWAAADDARIGLNAAAITTEATTRASADSALASSISSLTSTVNGQSANITTLQSTSATLNGQVTTLNAKYSVKVTAGKVVGFELNSNGVTSDFTVQADKFKVENASGTPFEVIGGTVYLKDAMINTLNASKITTGTLNTSLLSIDGLTITNSGGALKIGDAGVGTGQLAVGAVSDINYAIGGGQSLTTSWAVIQSLTIFLSQTSTVLLTGAAEFSVFMTSAALAQHGVQMAIIKSGESPGDITSSLDVATYLNYSRGLSLRRVRVLAAGTHTFQIVAKMSSNGAAGSFASATNPYLEATVLKR